MIIITFGYRYRKQIIIGVILLVLIGSLTFYLLYQRKNHKESDKTVSLLKKKETKEEKEKIVVSEEYRVDIKGEIMQPGIYSVELILE